MHDLLKMFVPAYGLGVIMFGCLCYNLYRSCSLSVDTYNPKQLNRVVERKNSFLVDFFSSFDTFFFLVWFAMVSQMSIELIIYKMEHPEIDYRLILKYIFTISTIYLVAILFTFWIS